MRRRPKISLRSETSCGPDQDGNTIDECVALEWARRLQKHADGINAILAEAKEIFPNANLYFEPESGLHLMWAESHGSEDGDDRNGREGTGLRLCRPERIIYTAHLDADAGGW